MMLEGFQDSHFGFLWLSQEAEVTVTGGCRQRIPGDPNAVSCSFLPLLYFLPFPSVTFLAVLLSLRSQCSSFSAMEDVNLGLLFSRQSSGTCSAGSLAEEATCVQESTC